jgi:nudix-type nucleoside diphosphatase (YffH/AdpP family)
MAEDDISGRVRLRELKILSDNHYTLRRAEFDFQRSDGRWQDSQRRESYDMGDGAAILLLDQVRGMVLLIKQFRWPPFERGHHHLLIEAVAGKLDGDDPETCVRREAMEEAGVTVGKVALVTWCFPSPGAVTERMSLFIGEYDSAAPRARGGGHEHEGEDIETLELTLDTALAMAARGEIIDMKTILLLQAAKLRQTSF